MLGRVLCFLGFHKIDQEPSHRELLKSEGMNLIFWTAAIQKGLSTCRREGCEVELKVFRTGMCGMGGSSGPWQKLSLKKEAYIDSLPEL